MSNKEKTPGGSEQKKTKEGPLNVLVNRLRYGVAKKIFPSPVLKPRSK